jgi:predicted acetyltransferase
MTAEYQSIPVDARAAEALAGHGLRLELLDTSDTARFRSWLEVVARGFHGSALSEEASEHKPQALAFRRTTGVWDDASAEPASPVGTVASWPAPLTVPGGHTVTGWAISDVSVSPTHRRKGIARALLEAELRTAKQLGVPVSILTVSESTIYGRFGFAPSALAVDLTIDTRHAAWVGPAASGRLHFVPAERALVEGRELVDRARLQTPGEIELTDYLWERLIRRVGGDRDEGEKSLRTVRYDDADGVTQGLAVYRVTEPKDDFSEHEATVQFLVSATDDAYAALWRFLLELDLVGYVTAPLRSVDEPLLWQVSDYRAVHTTDSRDHLWLRILDVKAALEGRSYGAPGSMILRISDPLGFADQNVLVEVGTSGTALVTVLGEREPAGIATLAMTVNELGSLYLGGTSARTLARAGKITELRAGSLDVVDAAFHSTTAPWLSVWF